MMVQRSDATPTATATRRLFIAVLPPPEQQQRLAAHLHFFAATEAGLRVVPAENLHLTLRFLGEIGEERERQAEEACAGAVQGRSPFTLAVGGRGAFPTQQRPRVIWLGVQGEVEPLRRLHADLQDRLLRRGVVAQPEAFTPHITLARVQSRADTATRRRLGALLAAAPPVAAEPVHVAALSLLHSTLTPQGAHYTVLRTYALAAQDC